MKPSSKAEKQYIEEGCALGIRCDGRGKSWIYNFTISVFPTIPFLLVADPEALRTISIENNIFPHVNGSSRLRVDGAVDIICSLKVFNSLKNTVACTQC